MARQTQEEKTQTQQKEVSRVDSSELKQPKLVESDLGYVTDLLIAVAEGGGMSMLGQATQALIEGKETVEEAVAIVNKLDRMRQAVERMATIAQQTVIARGESFK